MTLYSYVIPNDYGLAPNPFWGRMTLTVCKPIIRKNACLNDWVIGIGSSDVLRPNKNYINFAGKLVFAMKVSQILKMKDYDSYCTTSKTEIKNKIPKSTLSWKHKVGDCVYKYPINGNTPILRSGMHCSDEIETDLGGENALISDHFFYFGENAIEIDKTLSPIIKSGRGHLKCENFKLINSFISWIENLGYELNSINGEPQLKDTIDWSYYQNPYTVIKTKIYRLS